MNDPMCLIKKGVAFWGLLSQRWWNEILKWNRQNLGVYTYAKYTGQKLVKSLRILLENFGDQNSRIVFRRTADLKFYNLSKGTQFFLKNIAIKICVSHKTNVWY